MVDQDLAPAAPHGEIEAVFDDIFFVTGSVTMIAPVAMRFSRNMTIVRQGSSLTIVNSMRLDDSGLAALDALGKVEHVIRLAGFHGMDDRFYKERYDAKVWAMKGHVYAKGFNAVKMRPEDGYFQADELMDPTTALPIEGAELFSFGCVPPEGILRLDREGGILIAGDSLQNWAKTDRYFSFAASMMMRVMGFIKAHNVGPGWLKGAKPKTSAVRSILDLDFEHVLPVHGSAVIGGAKEKFRPAIERVP